MSLRSTAPGESRLGRLVRHGRLGLLGRLPRLSRTDGLPHPSWRVPTRPVVEPLTVPPDVVRRRNLDLVTGALDHAGVPYFVVRTGSVTRTAVGLLEEHRAGALKALAAACGGEPVYVQSLASPDDGGGRPEPAARASDSASARAAAVVRVGRFYAVPGSTLKVGMGYSCDLEFWSRSPDRPGFLVAPRPNVAAEVVPETDLSPAPLDVGGRTYPSAAIFTRRMLDDVDFPVDVVYTWVDGGDPEWLERMSRARSAGGREPHHALTEHPCRFRNRDELRYSLRSLTMYAPWVRHVYVVTDGQVPDWLDTGHGRVTVVDHRDIFADASALPVFNSSAIISQLHHIDGLSEHYVFMNDDVFLGRPVAPTAFFHSNGLAKVFPSRHRRPFGPPDAEDLPHVNISRNIRSLLERELGVTISRAVKHTPHAQLRSVQYEMEQRFADAYARTARSRFRHRDDIAADQLFHYYAYLTGRAAPGQLQYRYVNSARATDAERLEEILARRDCDAFCLNDAIAPDQGGVPDQQISEFLRAYFPIASEFERT